MAILYSCTKFAQEMLYLQTRIETSLVVRPYTTLIFIAFQSFEVIYA